MAAWVLRSPYADGVHVTIGGVKSESEGVPVARLFTWKSVPRDADERWPTGESLELLQTASLPDGIRAVTWCRGDPTAPTRFAACSANEVQIVDLACRLDPRHIRARYKLDGVGTLNAIVSCAGVGGGGGDVVVVARAGYLLALDVATGSRVWSYPAGGVRSQHPITASVRSVAAISAKEVVASWAGLASDPAASGSIHMLDLRTPPNKLSKTDFVHGTAAVDGLAGDPFDDGRLVASFSTTAVPSKGQQADGSIGGGGDTYSEVFVWDLRRRYTQSQPVTRVHSGHASLRFGPLLGPGSLSWSPSKRCTLLAVAGSDTGEGGQARICRLWSHEHHGSTNEAEGSSLVSPISWLGEDQPLRTTDNVVAACWAHASRPDQVVSLTAGGRVVSFGQRMPRTCFAWNPRGGLVCALPWAASGGNASRNASAACPSALSAQTLGVPPSLEISSSATVGDVCNQMYRRAASLEYGIAGQVDRSPQETYDKYAAAVRASVGTNGRTSEADLARREALASAWQWVKLADSHIVATSYAAPIGNADDCWGGVKRILALHATGTDEKIEDVHGVRAFDSQGRRSSLQALGFPKPEAFEPTQPPLEAGATTTSPSLTVDDAVRRILRAVVWLQFDRAASECELLEPHCQMDTARSLLPQLGLVFHAAECSLGRGAARAQGASGSAAAAAAFRFAHRSAMTVPWNGMPSADTLRVAVHLTDVVVAVACGSQPFLPISIEGEGTTTFEDRILALLRSCRPSPPQAISTGPPASDSALAVVATLGGESSARAQSAAGSASAAPAVASAAVAASNGNTPASPPLPPLPQGAMPVSPRLDKPVAKAPAIAGVVSGTTAMAASSVSGSSTSALGAPGGQSGVGVDPVAIGASKGVASTGGSPSHRQFDRHVSASFCCALALRFLPRGSLEASLDAIHLACRQYGLLDGLCLVGLGGDQDARPITASVGMDLVDNYKSGSPGTTRHPASTVARSLSISGDESKVEEPAGKEDWEDEIAGDTTTVEYDEGSDLVVSYVARTGDVQSAAVLFCHAAHLRRPPGLQQLFAVYVTLLARWELHHQRASLHKLIMGKIPRDDGASSRAGVLSCFYCNNPLTGGLPVPPVPRDPTVAEDIIARRCPHMGCLKKLPSCAICLLPVFVVRSNTEAESTSKPTARLEVDNWLAWCQVCHHGGHMSHIEEWFTNHVVCPVAGCDCQCGLY
eukprot:TRINITY_DN34673_c0_g1_i1.p1 TRINITY_DN34673_c0_g1~~TRINITY_DN34673_c0_g1_i1.p1  ORF type:complete len:1233 (+),score=161.43 TRINITY_DN34673_c0_g1_i1:93-3701(+)